MAMCLIRESVSTLESTKVLLQQQSERYDNQMVITYDKTNDNQKSDSNIVEHKIPTPSALI